MLKLGAPVNIEETQVDAWLLKLEDVDIQSLSGAQESEARSAWTSSYDS